MLVFSMCVFGTLGHSIGETWECFFCRRLQCAKSVLRLMSAAVLHYTSLLHIHVWLNVFWFTFSHAMPLHSPPPLQVPIFHVYWHVAVLVGSLLHFLSVYLYVVHTPILSSNLDSCYQWRYKWNHFFSWINRRVTYASLGNDLCRRLVLW